MGRCVYMVKMCLVRGQLKPRDKRRTVFVKKLLDITWFICLIYAKYWFSSTIAADAPVNDLQLYFDLLKYREVNATIADACLKKLERHMWYLKPETVIFSLCSKKVSPAEKLLMALKLTTFPRPDRSSLTSTTDEDVSLNDKTTLVDLVTAESYTLFNMLDIEDDFLYTNPEEWEMDEDYNRLYNYVYHLKVVNDVSERTIWMMTRYANKLTHDAEMHAFIMQVVEAHIAEFPDFRKSTLDVNRVD